MVIIDSPDFTHRVARRVRRANPSIPIVDYVSPSVWAWRPGTRARHAALCRSCPGAAAFRAGGTQEARRPALHLCRSSAGRAGRRVAAERREANAAAMPTRRFCWCLPGSRRSEIKRLPSRSSARSSASPKRSGRSTSSFRRPRILPMSIIARNRELAAASQDRGQARGPPRGIPASRAWRWQNPARSRSSLRLSGVPMVTAYKVSRIEAADRAAADHGAVGDPRQSRAAAKTSCRNSSSRIARRKKLVRCAAAAVPRQPRAPAAGRGLPQARRDHGNRQSRARAPCRRNRSGGSRAQARAACPAFNLMAGSSVKGWRPAAELRNLLPSHRVIEYSACMKPNGHIPKTASNYRGLRLPAGLRPDQCRARPHGRYQRRLDHRAHRHQGAAHPQGRGARHLAYGRGSRARPAASAPGPSRPRSIS